MLVPALLIAIPVHEMGHAAAAYFQGDRSVRYFGYFTLDPRRFLDPLGVIAVFVALVGWGRRVPVKPTRISSVRQRLVPAPDFHPVRRADRLRPLRDRLSEPIDIRLPAAADPGSRRLGCHRDP